MYFETNRRTFLKRVSQASGFIFVGSTVESILAACGGPSTPATTNTMTLNVGQISNSIAFFPFYVAEQQGFFKDAGLTLGSRPRLGTGAKVGAALTAGSIDIGGGVFTDAFYLATVDSQARVIGALVNGYYNEVIAGKKLEQDTNLTESSPLADKVLALKGKKIGITGPGSGTEALLIYLFRQHGLDTKKDAQLVSLGSDNTAALNALRTGRVDALCFPAPVGPTVHTQGVGDLFISPISGDVPSLQGAVLGVFYTRQSVIDAKPQAIRAFIRAVAQAEAFIQNQPAKARTLLKSYTKLDQKTVDATYAEMTPVLAQDPRVSQQGYNVVAQFHVQAGLISVAPAYKDMVAADTIDKALA